MALTPVPLFLYDPNGRGEPGNMAEQHLHGSPWHKAFLEWVRSNGIVPENPMDRASAITRFIEARLDEAVAAAEAVLGSSCRSYTWWEDDIREHAEWMLRDVQAKRRLLAEVVPIVNDLDEIAESEGLAAKHPKRVGVYLSAPTVYLLELLAEPWSEHEDYAALFAEKVSQ